MTGEADCPAKPGNDSEWWGNDCLPFVITRFVCPP